MSSYRKTQQTTTIRPHINDTLVALSEAHDIAIVDLNTYMIAYLVTLPKESRNEVLQKGMGIAFMSELGAKFTPDMSESDFTQLVESTLKDAPETENNT